VKGRPKRICLQRACGNGLQAQVNKLTFGFKRFAYSVRDGGYGGNTEFS